ncbi:MAG: DNA-directed RNA polymerase subunit alpha [Patescibacteria group bacterium]|nr:DNA-directed RNA polymerase subunit alpha [Patescibacteria group bacterium]
MEKIALPQEPKYIKGDDFEAVFEVKGCYPGYGNTLGNALRRVLLSSLSGYAVTKVKISGVDHEFTTIPGVKENVIQVILNIRNLRFKMHKDEAVKIKLKASGAKEVKAKEIKAPSSIEIVNPEAVIATLTDAKAKLEMELTVEKGIGYLPTEEREEEVKELGVVSIDALFTPIKKVNYKVENMRVGKRTDFDKLTIEIQTDGSIKPEEAFIEASKILIKQFAVLAKASQGELIAEVDKELEKREGREIRKEEKRESEEQKKRIKAQKIENELEIKELNLPPRVVVILEENNIKTLGDIGGVTEEELNNLEGLGEKGIKEIKKAIGSHGLVLGG